ncbi:MAG: endopeptidase La [Dehalococcoidia bacterium]|nr:MAG: endopeptidase La [Dehalococcoidia bacterium]
MVEEGFIISEEEELELPLLPRRDTVIFPHLVTQLIVIRQSSLRAIEEAIAHDRAIVVVARRDLEAAELTFDHLYSIGTEATIGRHLKMPDGTGTLWIHGQRRVRITRLVHDEPFFKVKVVPIEEATGKPPQTEALMRAVLALFEKSIKLSPTLPEDAYIAAMNIEEPGWLADFVASSLDLTLQKRQEILEALDPYDRLQRINILLARELDVLELQSKIHTQVQEEVDKSQREYFLREQLKAIQKELGDVDPLTREMNELKEKIASAGMPEAVMQKANEEVERLATMPPASPEVSVIRTYLDWLVTLPWDKETEDNLDIKQAAKVLDENHYGLTKVKERILEYMSVRKLSEGKLRSPILCFVGAPGTGKTSLGKSIAQALGRKFVRISLGGIRDEAEIRGHRRTYVGALPGRIIQTMRTAATINPLFMMDEIDKVGMDFRGDPSSALLEVLDPEQNFAFSDHYLDVPYNLSKVMFITTANVLDPILPALRDRMEVIELSGYTEEEKLGIAVQFLVPKQLSEHALTQDQLRFSTGALRRIIREYTREAGVRNLEREIGNICRKVARLVAEGERPPHLVTSQSLAKYLGPQKFFWGTAEEWDEIGVAMGVARTEMGGDILGVEVTLMEGRGNLTLTGQLGDVMRESAQAALSYARSKASEFGVDPKLFEKTDIHIHVPAGAVPKDGPSAGITIATALISALVRQPVHKEVAMTGEITLRGRVLPVGGLKEKVLAAHRAGIKTFVMPKKNEKDLGDIPANVRRDVRFVYVQQMDEVLATALVDKRF